ncbi:hypothetical protein AWM75_07775 [Aerococcus urinaehominis]|uniref:Uncharacterized protein n=1 Tax=Aerococcus urinaehominis TaxID=128944 RepID=A0A0X8FM75_9LACT|nr:glycosyltransferase [Aerococcus urinaehominis]AMB99870.1 hypothetical protein AWM75_07775 [Aerococcus urinaehominis]SDM54413.1 Glycosyltransferase involved in cell wall bisynthesis [Aerococcus urinaehominis]
MKVSIIMPVYNKEKFIEKSINSVLNQNFEDFELIIIDDGSTDSSKKIIEQFIDSRIKYIYQKNQGVSVARNKGIEVSKGEYISFIDADDTYEKSFLKEMLNTIDINEVAYCGHNNIYANKQSLENIEFINGNILINYLKNRTTPHTNSWLIKKSLINRHQIRFNEKLNWGEDMLFFIEVILNSEQVACERYLTNYYRLETNNLSEDNLDKIEKDIQWQEKAMKKIYMNSIYPNQEEAVNIIKGYRMPAAIIYRLLSNLKLLDKKELAEYIVKYSEQLKSIKINNGLKSVKLLVLLFYLKVRAIY